jgi:RNA ligase (TIGR02306 family)
MENLNSVCYVGLVCEIKPIEGADNIELAVVGGWNAIVKKGEYKVTDLVVVATTDAVIPLKLSDAMGVTGYLRKGQRVRTVKLRGVYSECLIIPIESVPEKYRYEGSDCMELLGVFKYEPPVKMVEMSVGGRKVKYHQNPNFHVYHKFPNLKNVPELFTEEDEVVITRKLHGTNARYGIVRKKRLKVVSLQSLTEENRDERQFYMISNTLNPEETSIKKEESENLKNILEHLPQRYRTLIILKYYDEKSYEEISQQLDLPLGTVKAQLSRARELMSNIMNLKKI